MMDRLPPRSAMSSIPPLASSSLRASHNIAMSSSPGAMSSLVHHSVPGNHALDRTALLALQDAYTNPQMADEYMTPRTASKPRTGITMLPASIGVESHLAKSDEDYFAPPTAAVRAQSPPPFGQRSPSLSISSQQSRVDPTPLLAHEPEEPLSPTSIAAGIGHPLPSASDPHKPLRRWLYQFPAWAERLFYRLDTVATRYIQMPLATVGGLTTSLEEEILESNEMSNQQRREEELRRDLGLGRVGGSRDDHSIDGPSSVGPSSPSHGRVGSGGGHHTVLRKSMAITWRNKLLVGLALLVSGFTTIELGVFFSFFLFAGGYDEIATMQLLTTSLAAVFSQCFKRFLWRPRPWMQSRSIQVKRDKTSSFPSRAVTCAVVYAYAFAHLFYPPHSVPPWYYLLLCATAAVAASISRIFVGAHFASDCLAGLLMGAIFCSAASGLNRAIQSGCGQCYYHADFECYASSVANELSFSTFGQLDMVTLSILTAVSVCVVGLAMSSPLHFWTKCTSIFGILFPLFGVRLVLLCPSHNSAELALLRVAHRSPLFIFQCLLLSLAVVIFTKLLAKLTVLEHGLLRLSTDFSSTASDARADMEPSISISRGPSRSASRSQSQSQCGSRADGSGAFGGRSESRAGLGLGHTEADSRHFLQFSSFGSMCWNLAIYFVAYAAVFFILLAWRANFVEKRDPAAMPFDKP